MSNLLIMHGGAPTSVINASLAGVITKLREKNFKGKILGARYGSKGLLEEDFIDLTNISNESLERLKITPGTSIGSSRTPLGDEEYNKIASILKKNNISYVLANGGNGSMDTLGKMAKATSGNIKFVGIPKTVDNDIMETDHAPGFASAGSFLANVVRSSACDLKGLPIHVSVMESMGRNVGWLTAMGALARNEEFDAPHLLCFPEIPFDEEAFLTKTEELFRKKGGVSIVASEGLKGKDGKPIVEPILTVGRATYFGDVSTHLSTLIIKKLGIKARSEKPGILNRCATNYASRVDVEEAFLVGEEAAHAVLEGKSGVMVGIERVSTNPYVVKTKLVPIEKVMLTEKVFPREYISNDGFDVTESFIKWATPLVDKIPNFITFLN